MVTQKRPAIFKDEYALIPLRENGSQGFAKIDKEFSYLADNHFFYLNAQGYPMTKIDKKLVRLHRLIFTPSAGKFVDHINGNKLDNRKCNLREATLANNSHNRSKLPRNTSGYKCVFKVGKRWRAKVQANGVVIHGGYFNTALEAAKKANEIIIANHGDFARINEI